MNSTIEFDQFQFSKIFAYNSLYEIAALLGSGWTLSAPIGICIVTYDLLNFWPNFVTLILTSIETVLAIWGYIMWNQIDDSNGWGAESSYRAFLVGNI